MIADFRLKTCPRCGGDMASFRDKYGAYWGCLRCGCHDEGLTPLSMKERVRHPRLPLSVAMEA